MACSKVGLGYSIGTSQIKSKVDDAFDFSPRSKSKDVDQFLSAEFAKNKKIFFVKLKDQLQKLEVMSLKSDLNDMDIDKLYSDGQIMQKEIISMFKPSFNKVFTEISDAEIKVYKEYSSEQISEREKEAEDTKSFKKKKFSNFTRVAEFLLDDLTKDQEDLINKFIDEHLEFYKNQIRSRKKFNADLIALYPQKDKMIDFSIAYCAGDASIRSDEYKKERAFFEQEIKKLIVSLWKLRSKDQTVFFQNRLKDVIVEIDKIISDET